MLFRVILWAAAQRRSSRGQYTRSLLAGKLKPLIGAAGLVRSHFSVMNRVVTSGMGSLACPDVLRAHGSRWCDRSALADALKAAHLRRAKACTLYSVLPFVTLIATKPSS